MRHYFPRARAETTGILVLGELYGPWMTGTLYSSGVSLSRGLQGLMTCSERATCCEHLGLTAPCSAFDFELSPTHITKVVLRASGPDCLSRPQAC